MIVPNDIVLRKARNGKATLWVAERLLVSVCEGLSTTYLEKRARPIFRESVPAKRRDQDIMPDTNEAWRFARMNGQWYYDYDRIPDRAPTKYQSKLGTKEELLANVSQAQTESRLEQIETLVKKAVKTTYRDFIPDYEGIPTGKVEPLAQAAAVLAEAFGYFQSMGLEPGKSGFFVDFATVITKVGVPLLPKNYRVLRDKFLRLLDGERPTEIVAPVRLGNQNAVKFDDPDIVAWLIVMRASGVNASHRFIARRAQMLCVINGKPVPSMRWCEARLSLPEVEQMTWTRYGKDGRRALPYKGYVPTKGAAFAGDCWLMDGTRVNLLEFSEGETKWRHVMVVVVYDMMSGAFLSRHYCDAENRWAYCDALAKAATSTGYLPHTLVIDRFPGHDTDEWKGTVLKLEQQGVKVSVTHQMQGKARLERAFATWQQIGLQHSPYYYGEGIESSRDFAHRSEDYKKAARVKAKNEGWCRASVIKEAERAFERYNSTRMSEYSRAYASVEKSPAQLHQESDKPFTLKAEPFEMLWLFGLSKTVQVRHMGMLVTEINKVKYTYVIDPAHYDAVKRHRQVTVYYDLEDLTRVTLYTVANDPRDEMYLCEANDGSVGTVGPTMDGAAIGKAKARNAEWERRQQQDLAQYVGQVGSATNDMMGLLSVEDERAQAEEEAWRERARKSGSVRKEPVVVTVEEEEEAPQTRAGSRLSYY
jgi:hypothetical protein